MAFIWYSLCIYYRFLGGIILPVVLVLLRVFLDEMVSVTERFIKVEVQDILVVGWITAFSPGMFTFLLGPISFDECIAVRPASYVSRNELEAEASRSSRSLLNRP